MILGGVVNVKVRLCHRTSKGNAITFSPDAHQDGNHAAFLLILRSYGVLACYVVVHNPSIHWTVLSSDCGPSAVGNVRLQACEFHLPVENFLAKHLAVLRGQQQLRIHIVGSAARRLTM